MNYVTREEFQALEQRVAKLESIEPLLKEKQRPTSVREFILEKKPKSDTDTCICFMYFLEEHGEGDFSEGVSSNNLKKTYQEARERVPKNVSDILSRCANKGWIDKVGKDGKKIKWRLTNKGMRHVEKLGDSEA